MIEIQAQSCHAKDNSVVAKCADVLVRRYVLSPGEFIPWCHHTEVSDNYNPEGMVLIEARVPVARRERNPDSPCDAFCGAPCIQFVR